MRRWIVVLSILLTAVSCAKKEVVVTESVSATTTTAAASTAATPTATTTAPSGEPNLISFTSGSLIVQKPKEYDSSGWSAFRMFDERANTGWASPENDLSAQVAVIALAERTIFDRLSFDNASADGAGRAAKDVVVEMSDTSAMSGFQNIATVSLADQQDNQNFPVSAQVPGRWLRVTIKNNHGSTQYLELFEIRGFGRQLTQTPFANASGTYSTEYGNFHLRQEGTSVTGCYEHSDGVLTGGIEGRVMKFQWRQSGENNQGPAIMVFSPDGKGMFGLWWRDGETDSAGGIWSGAKISDEVGSCPHWSGGAEAQMAKELDELGRTRLYGINFDTDSNVIRNESKPTLDKVVAVMKARAEWKLQIEGHTDASGDDAHNQQLSQQRAEAVKTYLVGAGIGEGRLSTAGLGSSKPVAENATASGRAQNRRVELARQ